MEELAALRRAVIENKEIVQEEGGALVIDGVRYNGQTETPFKRGNTDSHYPLMALWLQFKMKDAPFIEYVHGCRKTGIFPHFVIAPDKKAVLDYLTGISDEVAHIDQAVVKPSVDEQALLHEEVLTFDQVVKSETCFRTRASVLEAPGRSLREQVFGHFVDKARHDTAAATADNAAAKKRPRTTPQPDRMENYRGTPIIVVPASTTSLINLYNVQQFLQQGRFVTPNDARILMPVKPTKITIERKDSKGNPSRYYVIDNVSVLQKHEWPKIVAVFAQGPDWQFKDWRWGREKDRPDITPVEIFDRCLGFHVHYEGDIPHPNIAKWSVIPLVISKTRRHLDSGEANKFWASVDQHILVKKPYLLPKPQSEPTGTSSATPRK